MERETWEVAPHGDDGWGVKRERAESLHMTKETAIARGVELASAAAPHGQLLIKRADGNDPNPPKG
jgi:hypothetical protein